MTNYEFEIDVLRLVERNIESREERMNAIQELIERYMSANGIRPPAKDLEVLANYILKEELKDDHHPDKMSRNEYAIASVHQIQRRRNREYSFDYAENRIASDLNEYGRPTRKTYTKKGKKE